MKYVAIQADGKIGEIPQNSPTRFAMCDESGKALHAEIKCRDFFSDVLMVRDGIRKTAGVWGFTCDKNTYSNIIAAIEAPKCVVDELNALIPGVKAEKSGDVWLYTFPEEWMENPILVSLSTGIIRVRNYDQRSDDDKKIVEWLKKPDISAIRALTVGWRKAIKNKVPILTVHNNSGIVSFINGRTWWK